MLGTVLQLLATMSNYTTVQYSIWIALVETNLHCRIVATKVEIHCNKSVIN